MPRFLLRVLRRDVPFRSTALLAAVVLAWCSAAAAPVPSLKALTIPGEVCLQSTTGVNDFTHGLDKVGNHGRRVMVIDEVQLRDADGLVVVGAFQASVHHEGFLRGTSSGWTARGQGLRRLNRTISPGEAVDRAAPTSLVQSHQRLDEWFDHSVLGGEEGSTHA